MKHQKQITNKWFVTASIMHNVWIHYNCINSFIVIDIDRDNCFLPPGYAVRNFYERLSVDPLKYSLISLPAFQIDLTLNVQFDDWSQMRCEHISSYIQHWIKHHWQENLQCFYEVWSLKMCFQSTKCISMIFILY
jgi:hypothetical protein